MTVKATEHQSTAAPISHRQTVGLMVLDIANPFFAEVARGAEDAARESRVAVILCNSDGSVDQQSRYLEILHEQQVGGLAVTPADERLDGLALLQDRGIAVVLLDHPSESADMCSVSVDNVKGGTYVGRHLTSLGHQRVAFIGPKGVRQVTDRRQGLRDAMTGAGHDTGAVIDVVVPALTAEHGKEAAARLLRGGLPSAAFCSNDLLAMGLMQGLEVAGVRVPDDVAIVGYDDIPYSAALQTPLTTVRQPRYGLGQAAMRLLLDHLANPAGHKHQQKVFTPELVVRASSTP